MAKPITIPNTFANATTAIPLSQLDNNYSVITASINDANTYSNYAADSGSANAYVVALANVSTTYTAGLRIQFKAANTNSGASTLNVNSQGAKNIYLNNAAVSANVIQANAVIDCIYDGTQFQIISNPGTLPSVPVTAAQGGTGQTSLTANNVILGNGTSAVQFVAPGTNGNVLTSNGTTWISQTPASGVSLSANNTWTGTQTFAGTSSVISHVMYNAAEVATVSATAATGTINYDVTTQSVLYYTTNASANWTVNFRGSSGTSLNTLMSTGQSITVAFLVTQGGTAYYNNVVQIDGTTVTPKYQGGTAWSAGNASSIDAYVYTIVKTNNATFTVFASQTKFA